MDFRYIPTHIDDFLGNQAQKQCMLEFLNDKIHTCHDTACKPEYSDSMVSTIDISSDLYPEIKIKRRKNTKKKPSSIIVLAPSGMGKTTFCELLFAHYDVFVIKPFYELFNCHNQLIDYLESSIRTVNILKSRQQKVIFLDDIDILFSNDRYSSCYIQRLINRINTEMLPIKVIITCSIHEERKLCDLKKISSSIKLDSPSLAECQKVVRNLLKGEGEDDEFCDKMGITSLIKVLKFNLRSIISNLHMFSTFAIDKERKHQRYSNLNIFETCQLILDSAHDIDVTNGDTNLPVSDTSLISLILYDNLRPYMQHNYALRTRTYLEGFIHVLNTYVFGSIIEANAYDMCSWKNVETANFVKIGAIQMFLRTQTKKDLQKTTQKTRKGIRGNEMNETNNTKQVRSNTIQYTTITTRASQHYSNARKMEKYASKLDVDCNNVRLMCEVAFEAERQYVYRKHVKYSRSSEESILMNNYIRNICHPHNKVFSKRMLNVFKIKDDTFFLRRRIMR